MEMYETINDESLGSVFFLNYLLKHKKNAFWDKVHLFSKDALNRTKVTITTFILFQKISVSNKCCSF